MNAGARVHAGIALDPGPLLAMGSMISIQSAAALSQPLLLEIGATPTT
jgi:hypothetical protein